MNKYIFWTICSIIGLAIACGIILSFPHKQSKTAKVDQQKLFSITIIYDEGRSEDYCYAKDKYDAERMFNDSLQIETLAGFKEYYVREVVPLNKPK